MAPDKKKFREDQVFEIITGYYPEIATNLFRDKKMGRGPVGAKFIKRRGYTDATIDRETTKNLADDGPLGPTKESVVSATTGKKLFKRMTGTRTDANKHWYKFTGGSEQYKLYGDQVWYMAGIRPKDEVNMLTSYVNSFGSGSNTPRFGNIYTKMEGQLIQEAAELVDDIFDRAVQAVEIEINEGKRSSSGEMASEELGYSTGDFQYLSHDQVKQQYGDNEEIMAQISKVQGSTANPGDLYRVQNGQLQLIQDVTEQPIGKSGQHGVHKANIPKSLIDAIKEIKKGPEGQNLSMLRKGVKEMYTNAIKNDYNPVIRKIKEEAKIKTGDGKQWSDALHEMKKLANRNNNSVKAKRSTTSVAEIAQAIGIEMTKSNLNESSQKSARQVALEQIAHVLGRMNEGVSAQFRQAHRVHTYMPSGMSVYASADLTPNPETWLFEENVKESSIAVFEGYSASLGQERLASHGIKDRGLAIHKSNKHAYSATKVTGMAASGTGVSAAIANMGITKGLAPATVVHYPAAGEIEEALIQDIKNGIPDIAKRLGRGPSGKLGKRVYGLGNRKKRMDKGLSSKQFKSVQFWALPYVGVLQSEYIED
tara:strand:+ start:79 stop:1860 length:1782 start_codon:yes stop_codon:yes gene_type:complete